MFRNFSASDWAAWWGAVVATLLFLWELYKWWYSDRPRLDARVSPNMRMLGDPRRQNKDFITFRVSNIGTRATTITGVGFHWYPSSWAGVRGKPGKSFVIASPGVTQPVPYLLQPGDIWDGAAHQDTEILALASTGQLIAEIYHSGSRKPIRRRVAFKTREAPNKPLQPPSGA